MKKTYRGSCHCRAVTFEADIDLSQGTGKCNCTVCWKQRMWNAGGLAPSDFRLLTGEDMLGDYRKYGDWGEGHHRFCRRCGIATHSHGQIKQMGNVPFVSVHLAALDDLPIEELIAAPVRCMDGLHDNWGNPPAEIRHL
ncbi:GFA family protein [Belnapia sp. T18]|uniref:GFA family protein n=1 Tax=Belnapia arida TaxID=2804533 RepID=A0ABS1UDS4_9PROT|nr:GFA family protein [Belnapia arida]